MAQNTRTTSRITDRLSRLASRVLSVNPIVIKEMRAQVQQRHGQRSPGHPQQPE